MNCEAPLGSRFCGECGQDHRHVRLETTTMLKDACAAILDFESTFWMTFRGLIWRPGQLAREYVAGHRRRYTHPIRYLLIALTFYALVMWLTGLKPSDIGKEFQPQQGSAPALAFQQAYVEWADRNFSLLFMTIIPMLALSLRIVFRRRGLNFAECLVLPAYAHAQSTFIITPVFLAAQQYLDASALWGMGASLVYQTWAVWGFFQTKWWKALAAYLFAFAMWYVAFIVVTLVVVIVIIATGVAQF